MLDRSSLGVGVAIVGNSLISVALNIQKHVHNKLHNDPAAPPPPPPPLVRIPSAAAAAAAEENPLIPTQPHSPPPPHRPYWREPLWWGGLVVMILGETGNFISYGFASAVLVAPLGTVALISNALIAPLFLGERLRTRDVLGILLAILGTCFIVAVSTSTPEPILTPDLLLQAVLQTQFLIHLLISLIIGIILYRLSSNRIWGSRFILIDLGLVALFGGYTVLSTKAISGLLGSGIDLTVLLLSPVTYIMALVLASTAVLQITFLNRSLANFDSTAVIPTNFVLFTTSTIIGSAVLYNDLARMSLQSLCMAVAGILLMFSGVFLITGNKQQQELKQNHQASSMTVSPSTLESDGVDECLAVVDEHSPLLLSSPTPLDGHQHHLHVTFAGPPAVYNSSSSRSSSSSSNSAAYFAEKSFASSHPSSAYASTTSSTPAAVAAATTTSNSSPHRVKTTASSSYSPSRIFFPRHRRVSSGLNGINNTTLKRFQPDLSPGTGTGLFLYRHRSNTTDGDEYHSSSDGNVADGCNTAGAFPRERVESVDQPPPPFVMEVGSSSPNTPSAHLFRQQQLQEQQQQQQQFQQPKTSRNSRILHWFSIGSKGSAGGRRKPSTTTTSSSSSSTTTTTTAARSISASTGLLQVLDSPFSSPVRGGGCGSSATIISTQTPGVASVLAFSSSAREAVKRELEAAEHSFKCSAGSVSGGSSSRK